MNPEQSMDKRRFQRIYNADYLLSPQDPPTRDVMDALLLHEDSVVVEFGTGQGHFTLPMAQRLEQMKGRGLIFAFDFSEKMIDRLNQEAAELGVEERIRAWSMENPLLPAIPVGDGKADRILCFNSLQYFDDPLPTCHELTRILAPAGFIFIVNWNQPTQEFVQNALAQSPSPTKVLDLLTELGLVMHVRVPLQGYSWAFRVSRTSSYV